MLLRGDDCDEAGRRFVTEQLAQFAVNPLPHAGDLLVVEPRRREVVARLDYDASPQTTHAALLLALRNEARTLPSAVMAAWSWSGPRPKLAVIRRRFEALEQDDHAGLQQLASDLGVWFDRNGHDDDGRARARLLLGALHHRLGDHATAATWWRSLRQKHPNHPLRHRAYYNLLDQRTWPTAPHADLGSDIAVLPPPSVPDVALRQRNLSALAGARYQHVGGLALAHIAAATFTMGGTPGWYQRELPARRVTISRSFYIGACTVTRAQWRQFRRDDFGDEHSELPATGVTWHDAVAYCKWLSNQTPMAFRLPTEAEWELACRGGIEAAQYPWGDEAIDRSRCNYALPRPLPVACYPPNAFGLFDMVGNVQQWCADYHAEDAYQTQPAIDPSGPTEPLNPREPRRILRGGMCGDEVCQVFCRNAYRLGAWEQWGGDVVGFRVVADIEA